MFSARLLVAFVCGVLGMFSFADSLFAEDPKPADQNAERP